MIVTLLGIFLLTLLLITVIGILRSASLIAASILLGLFSLQIASVFFILDAADVALTEAAVGAGISTVLLLAAIALTGDRERTPSRIRWGALAVVSVTTLLVLYATFDKPRLGDPLAPVHQHVAPWYLEQTPRLMDVPNVVTAILASYRGYDTLGELFVILTAGIGVLFLLSRGPGYAPGNRGLQRSADGLRHHLVPRVVGRMLVPFIVLFGLYVQFHGDFGPGGGFQAGALVAAGVILYSLLEGDREALRVVPDSMLTLMMVGGALLYLGVGIAGIVLGGEFLDYSVLRDDAVLGQQLGILLIELSVGLTVTGVLLRIYRAFSGRNASG